jgi:branched-chain amino acid transport system substrate-binding protein
MLASVVPSMAKDIPDEIKIGWIGTISGSQAIDGWNMSNAIKLVEKEIEDAGGFKIDDKVVKVTFIGEDTEGKNDLAVNAAAKLVTQDGVIAILGANNSGDTIAAAQITQEAKVPTISNTGTNVRVTQQGDFIFRACFIDPVQGKIAAAFIKNELGMNKAAIIFDNADTYSTGLKEAFEESFKAIGGEIVEAQAFSGADVKDYSAQLTNIKAADPEIVYVPCHIDNSPLIVQQMRANGIDCPVFGCESWDYQQFIDNSGPENVEGAYYTTGFSQEADTAKDFVAAFTELAGERPGFSGAMMYEAAHILLDAIQRAETIDGEGIRQALVETDIDWLPSGGRVTFDENRNPTKSMVVLQITDGLAKYVTTIAPED